jgi:hypothetical protein
MMRNCPFIIVCHVSMAFVFWVGNSTAAVADEAEAERSLAELPHWPVGLRLPEELTVGWKRRERMFNSPEAHVLVWTPTRQLRAVLLIPNNTDSKIVGEHDAVREVARRQQIGVVYLRHFDGSVVERSDPPTDAEKTFAAVLDLIATKTGVAEYRHAPWITFGKSSRGRFPFRTTWWFPKRVIASISYHGETPTWPMENWSRIEDESVLHLAINGQNEWSGTWYRHVRPCMLNYHVNTSWLTHQVVVYNVGHGDYVDMHGSQGWGRPVPQHQISCRRVWDYIACYIDKAMELRVPRDFFPTDRPTLLKQVRRDSGYLIHPRATEELLGMKWHAFRFRDGAYQTVPWPDENHPVLDPNPGRIEPGLLIRRAADIPQQERKKMFCVADLEQAQAWLALHDVHGYGAGTFSTKRPWSR